VSLLLDPADVDVLFLCECGESAIARLHEVAIDVRLKQASLIDDYQCNGPTNTVFDAIIGVARSTILSYIVSRTLPR
jgi:hypothetical protein